VIYFGTLAQRSPPSRATIRALVAQTPATRFLDLNLRGQADERDIAQASLILADWVKVNDDELATLLNWFGATGRGAPAWGSELHARAVAALIRRFELARLIVTRGAIGYAAFDKDGGCDIVGSAAPVAHLVDTIGAGDALSAMVLAGLVRGDALSASLEKANRFAAAVCGIAGPLPAVADDAFFAPWRA